MKAWPKRNSVRCAAALAVSAFVVAGCGVPMFLGSTGGFPFDPFGSLGARQDERTIGERFFGYANLAEYLLMTAEQRRAAEDIDDRLAEDVEALRDAARDQFLATLTEEQQALFDELGREYPEIRRLDFLAPSTSGFGSFGPLGFFSAANDRLRETVETRLGLSSEQLNALDDLRAQVPEDIQARQEAADEEFRALLDEGQLELLDDLLSHRGFFPF